MISLDRILGRVEAVPALSPAAVEAMNALERPDIDAPEIEKIIRLDPALVSTFLRMANAACFGNNKVAELRTAITRLGLKRVRQVITAAAVSRIIPPKVPGYEMSAEAFWSHCAATALLTEGIYVERAQPEPPPAFAAALLHDIGRLALGVLIEEVDDEIRKQLDTTDLSFEEIERQCIGADHALLGMRVATAWRLPAPIAHACAEHHNPEHAPDEYREMIEVVHLADLLSYTMGYGLDVGGLRHNIDMSVADRLSITSQQLDKIARATRDQIEDLVHLAEMS